MHRRVHGAPIESQLCQGVDIEGHGLGPAAINRTTDAVWRSGRGGTGETQEEDRAKRKGENVRNFHFGLSGRGHYTLRRLPLWSLPDLPGLTVHFPPGINSHALAWSLVK
ncbi:MAG: hypothetical protein ABSH44_09750 [Bryobacteraceae bacterium]